jgi:hypothetical protein
MRMFALERGIRLVMICEERLLIFWVKIDQGEFLRILFPVSFS